jgi:hypothetical protein
MHRHVLAIGQLGASCRVGPNDLRAGTGTDSAGASAGQGNTIEDLIQKRRFAALPSRIKCGEKSGGVGALIPIDHIVVDVVRQLRLAVAVGAVKVDFGAGMAELIGTGRNGRKLLDTTDPLLAGAREMPRNKSDCNFARILLRSTLETICGLRKSRF